VQLEVVKLHTAKRGFMLLQYRWLGLVHFRRLAREYEQLRDYGGRICSPVRLLLAASSNHSLITGWYDLRYSFGCADVGTEQ